MKDYFKEYEDYSFDDELYESLTFREKIKKFKNIKENKNIRFGIIVATYRRSDNTSKSRLTEALESIKSQTYTNYKIYLMGDDYENFEEMNEEINSFNSNKILVENVELPGERLKFKGADLWHSGSNTVANIAINKAIRDGMTHMVRLDHDDLWTKHHLTYLAKAITRYPKAKFFSTTALIKRYKHGISNYTRPEKGTVKHIGIKNLNNLTDSWHSAMCWDLKFFNDFRYRNVREQLLTEPIRPKPRGADRDFIQRAKELLLEKNLGWVNIPIITLLYRNKLGEIPHIDENDIMI